MKKEKIKQAIAIEYDPNEVAPKIIASGKGLLAERILDKAREESIPIHKDVS